MGTPNRFRSTTDLDVKILLTIWKWKLVSLGAIAEEFFGSQYSDAAYKRMNRLRVRSLVDRVCLPRTDGFVWTLTSKGFDLIRPVLPELREIGHRSEAPLHDYLCSALQRGPWISFKPDDVLLVSEQELRRLHSEHLSEVIPKSDFHRPDGYIVLRDESTVSITALEVELNRKAASSYAEVSSFYSADQVTRVLWITPKKRDADWLRNRIREDQPSRVELHQFVLLEDFLGEHWAAKVSVGEESGRRIHQLFDQPESPSLLSGEAPSMLDLRRRPYSSITSGKRHDRRFLDRIAFQASNAASASSTKN